MRPAIQPTPTHRFHSTYRFLVSINPADRPAPHPRFACVRLHLCKSRCAAIARANYAFSLWLGGLRVLAHGLLLALHDRQLSRHQGRHRHDDARRQLRRRHPPHHQPLDRHRRSQERAGRRGVVPRPAAAAFAADRARSPGVDRSAVAVALRVEHECGLHVLAAGDEFGRPGPRDAEAVEQTLRALNSIYDFVILDVGTSLMMPAAAALQLSDPILLVANPDVPCLRNLQRLIDAVKTAGVPVERLQIVLNRASEFGVLSTAQIERVLGFNDRVQRQQRLPHGRVGGELGRAGVDAAGLGDQWPARRDRAGDRRVSRSGAGPGQASASRRRRTSVAPRCDSGASQYARPAHGRAAAAGCRRAARPCRGRESAGLR